MSEFSNASFLLGLIGTLTGSIALGLSYATFRFQKPSLEMKVVSLSHSYHKAGNEGWFPIGTTVIRFVGSVEIKNKGDRGTTISQIVISFKSNGKEYNLDTPTFGKQTEITDDWGKKITNVEYRWINASELIGIPLLREWEFSGTPEDEIKCVVKLYSTRKTESKKVNSKTAT